MPRTTALVAAALFVAGCGGSQTTQELFVSMRGQPLAFTTVFASAELDASGLAVDTPERRIDAWLYPSEMVRFDNGFFVDEQALSSPLTGARLSVSPLSFGPTTTRADVEALLGPPTGVEMGDVGGAPLEVLRYRDPDIVAVSFVDAEITSVVAGIEVTP
ncbi:MAG: hypothetical protein KC619_34550 [Myxococcales bacterium]|nr:hypothetical protein [Myxococcales bacterium]